MAYSTANGFDSKQSLHDCFLMIKVKKIDINSAWEMVKMDYQ